MVVAKKNVIKLEFDAPATVLGIASNDKVWKVCWKINQQLGLNLATAEDDMLRVKGPELYTDFGTDAAFEFTFFENTFKSSKVPRLARQFRYWLVIKPQREAAPDVPEILRELGKIDNVSLAHDLSDEKDIKKLLP